MGNVAGSQGDAAIGRRSPHPIKKRISVGGDKPAAPREPGGRLFVEAFSVGGRGRD